MSHRTSVWDDDDDTDEELFEQEEEALRAALGVAAAIYAGVLLHRRQQAHQRNPHRLYLTRADLAPNPRVDTAWQLLYARRSDRAFITTMGFDVASFDTLLRAGFEDAWNSTPIHRNDVASGSHPTPERRSLDAAGALGLLLHYLNSTMREKSLQQIFALTPAVVSRYLEFAAWILLHVLRDMEEGKICWPKDDEFQELSDPIRARHPLLDGAFGCIDGLNLAVQVSDDPYIENMTYNGWLHGHFASCVLAFSALGVIISCVLNAPGSWHDAHIAEPIFDKLLERTPEGYYLVADTAFPRGPESIKDRIRAPLKDGDILPESVREREELLGFTRELVSFRQAAEWGMRAFQGSFSRLRLPLPVDQDKRGRLLELCARLFNVRTRLVGINQIRTTYVSAWRDPDTELWDSFEYMLFPEIRRRDRVSKFHCVPEIVEE